MKQAQLLDIIKQNQGITAKQIADKTGAKQATVATALGYATKRKSVTRLKTNGAYHYWTKDASTKPKRKYTKRAVPKINNDVADTVRLSLTLDGTTYDINLQKAKRIYDQLSTVFATRA